MGKQQMCRDRKIDGFWWTWMEGVDWPSWYYDEQMAREAQARIARANPGRKVKVGTLKTLNTSMTSGELVTVID